MAVTGSNSFNDDVIITVLFPSENIDEPILTLWTTKHDGRRLKLLHKRTLIVLIGMGSYYVPMYFLCI